MDFHDDGAFGFDQADDQHIADIGVDHLGTEDSGMDSMGHDMIATGYEGPGSGTDSTADDTGYEGVGDGHGTIDPTDSQDGSSQNEDVSIVINGQEFDGAATIDSDGDGHNDTAFVTLNAQGHQAAITDLDHDGKADEATIFDPQGHVIDHQHIDSSGNWIDDGPVAGSVGDQHPGGSEVGEQLNHQSEDSVSGVASGQSQADGTATEAADHTDAAGSGIGAGHVGGAAEETTYSVDPATGEWVSNG